MKLNADLKKQASLNKEQGNWEHTPYLIIGGGLSGLYFAYQLQQKQLPFILLEARDRLGGRIFCQGIENSYVDMGPAWVWPELQPRLSGLCHTLGIQFFKQYTHGDLLYELNPEKIQRYDSPSSHEQSFRIKGGAHALIQALQSKVAHENIRLNTSVRGINQETITAETNNKTYRADHIILALPLRISAHNIQFYPTLSDQQIQLWDNTPTWMASHCKIVFIYEHPFWREQGLSGEVFSQHGPLSEIYDGSPEDESYYALTSFVRLNAMQRKQIEQEELIKAGLSQLQHLFGDEAIRTQAVFIKDWSQEVFTTTEKDISTMAHHPQLPDGSLRYFSDKKIVLAGTETARQHGGYLEGAIESSDEALSILNIN